MSASAKRCRRCSPTTRASTSGSGFPSRAGSAVSTGRVEIGQGVLTAMRQIAAEELDVAPERIVLQTGDTELTPNEGYTAGSQSIQFGGVALRAGLRRGARLVSRPCRRELRLFPRRPRRCATARSSVAATPTGQDYWSLAGAVDLSAPRHRRRAPIKDAERLPRRRPERAARRPRRQGVRRAGLCA